MKKIEKGALTLTTDAVRATEVLRAAIRATGATTRRAEAVAAIFWCNCESGGLGSVRSRNGGGMVWMQRMLLMAGRVQMVATRNKWWLPRNPVMREFSASNVERKKNQDKNQDKVIDFPPCHLLVTNQM